MITTRVYYYRLSVQTPAGENGLGTSNGLFICCTVLINYYFGLFLRTTLIAFTNWMPLTVSTNGNTKGSDQTLVLCVLLLHLCE